MTDPYIPTLASFTFTRREKKAIAAAMLTAKPWGEKNDDIAAAKASIRALHLARRGSTCCYCCTNLFGGGPFMTDREHVLPKRKYKAYTFEVWNLSVSCKRCNMALKGEKDGFVVDKSATAPFQDSTNYRLIHPNFDDWEKHLMREMSQINMKVVVKFTVVGDSAKGTYTHTFFKLRELETDSYDKAQGIVRTPPQSLSEGALEAKAIARDTGQ